MDSYKTFLSEPEQSRQLAWAAMQAKLDDARFSAIFNNPAFALDPTDPRYSQSAGAQELAATIAKRKMKQQSKSQAEGVTTGRTRKASMAAYGNAEERSGVDVMHVHACMHALQQHSVHVCLPLGDMCCWPRWCRHDEEQNAKTIVCFLIMYRASLALPASNPNAYGLTGPGA